MPLETFLFLKVTLSTSFEASLRSPPPTRLRGFLSLLSQGFRASRRKITVRDECRVTPVELLKTRFQENFIACPSCALQISLNKYFL